MLREAEDRALTFLCASVTFGCFISYFISCYAKRMLMTAETLLGARAAR
jgi:hypothetical protein